MEIIETPLKDCFIIKNKVFSDDRGFFMESFNEKELYKHGIEFIPRQLNFAGSAKHVLRGLHYQIAPHSQSKLVGVIHGAVLDVVVDLRKESLTFKKSFKLRIVDRETMLFIPKGFAHGYYTLEDETTFYYVVDDFYSPKDERGILYNDKELAIDWELVHDPLISRKDLNQPSLIDADINLKI